MHTIGTAADSWWHGICSIRGRLIFISVSKLGVWGLNGHATIARCLGRQSIKKPWLASYRNCNICIDLHNVRQNPANVRIISFKAILPIHYLKAATVHARKAYRSSRDKAPFIPNTGITWRWVVSITSRPLYPKGKNPGNYWIGCWVGLIADLDVLDKRKISYLCLCSKPGLYSP